MPLANPTLLSFSSALPTDKIVAVYTGSFVVTSVAAISTSWRQYSFNHTFTRPVFTKMLWSTDSVTWYDTPSPNGTIGAICYSDSTSIKILTINTSGTIYYKVIAFWIDNFDNTNPLVAPTVGSNSQLYFDSRLNYQKIKQQAVITVTSDVDVTINHNLGYRPNVRVYIEALPGQVWPCVYGGAQNLWAYNLAMMECTVAITTTSIILSPHFAPSGGARIWYIIYYDA